MVEQRTTIGQRLDLVNSVLAHDATYRHALQFHYNTLSVLSHLSRVTGRRAPKRSAMLLSGIRLLYDAENRANGVVASMGDSTNGASAQFLQYAASKLLT
jgi:hypothetical protein